MRALLLVLGLAALVPGCSQGPTTPRVTDPYAPMYGTWTGLLMHSSDRIGWATTDSVHLIISATGSTPEAHLWQLKVEGSPGYPPAPNAVWREITFDPTLVDGGLVPVEDWSGSITATCGPDTATDAHGSLGWNRPAGTWGAVFKPDPPRSGPVTGLRADIFWPGITDSLGEANLGRQ